MNQQLYLPLGGVYPIPYEFETDTMPVPRGQFSILSELEEGNVTSAEAMVHLTLNHGSTWVSGLSWCLSTPYLSKIGGMSRRYVRDVLTSLDKKGWIETIKTSNPSGYRYRIQHHLCDEDQVPVDYDGKPLTFSVPRGPGGPLERCFDDEIPWKAALVWIVFKLRSEWRAGRDNTGQTWESTLLDLSKQCRMKLAGLQEMIKILEQQGMLQRLTPKSKPAIFQLYPKPYPRPVNRAPHTSTATATATATPRPSKGTLEFDGEGYFNREHYYSRNKLYRCSRETAIIEKRNGNHWSEVSDFHRSQVMNPNILKYFEKCLEAKRVVESAVFKDKL